MLGNHIHSFVLNSTSITTIDDITAIQGDNHTFSNIWLFSKDERTSLSLALSETRRQILSRFFINMARKMNFRIAFHGLKHNILSVKARIFNI